MNTRIDRCPGSRQTTVRPSKAALDGLADTPWPPQPLYRYQCSHCLSVRFLRPDGTFPSHRPTLGS